MVHLLCDFKTMTSTSFNLHWIQHENTSCWYISSFSWKLSLHLSITFEAYIFFVIHFTKPKLMAGSILRLNLPEKMYYSLLQEYICYIFYLIYLELYVGFGTFSKNWILSSNFAYIATAKKQHQEKVQT